MAHWIKSSMKCTSVSAVKMPSKQYAAVSALQPANSNVLHEKIVQPLLDLIVWKQNFLFFEKFGSRVFLLRRTLQNSTMMRRKR